MSQQIIDPFNTYTMSRIWELQ